MNSDDRTATKLSESILNTISMKPMFGDHRPPLIILDEIDGISGAKSNGKSAIDTILTLIRKKTDKSYVINRPIICICNDQFTFFLFLFVVITTTCTRSYEAAQVFTFKAVSKHALVKRLTGICRQEYLHVDNTTLYFLCDITQNDIRSCLHTLQSFKEELGGKQRIANRVTIDTLVNTPIGRKDVTNSLFEVWDRILKRKMTNINTKQKQHIQGYKKHHSTEEDDDSRVNVKSETAEWDEIVSVMTGVDKDKMMQGVHENYLLVGYSDPVFQKTLEASDWLCVSDLFETCIRSKQQFEFSPYLTYCCIGVHQVACATDSFARFQFPNLQSRLNKKINENKNIVCMLQNRNEHHLQRLRDESQSLTVNCLFNAKAIIPPGGNVLKQFFNFEVCVEEVIPYVLQQIYKEDFKGSGNIHLHHAISNHTTFDNSLHGREKRIFYSLINIMIECGLYYAKIQDDYMLQPPIDALQLFSFDVLQTASKAKRAPSRNDEIVKELMQRVLGKSMKNWLKATIRHQMELECMRRNESAVGKYNRLKENKTSQNASAGGMSKFTKMDKNEGTEVCEEDEDNSMPLTSCVNKQKQNNFFTRFLTSSGKVPLGAGTKPIHSEKPSLQTTPTKGDFIAAAKQKVVNLLRLKKTNSTD
ncbi:hypothetical protein RFI_01484 [Reticulomyxa filosa]|uniref:ATPase AAA-type core domain-containing protein n=1 Tax=Reticulomyxa filosa TaxID=46433 RepID=X6PAL7_RETFI|nr:hypothetical protein RFI_01484 [Reticulomyxa filosa]|eukprot:ETO35580.1 hypothetical protein RFI_01484 [Reticulomyxa filosa]